MGSYMYTISIQIGSLHAVRKHVCGDILSYDHGILYDINGIRSLLSDFLCCLDYHIEPCYYRPKFTIKCPFSLSLCG